VKKNKIKKISAREILNSRGNPTIEVFLETEDGFFISSVPSGASTGKYEAVELIDNEKRYDGKGVLKAIKNINEIIFPKLKGENASSQNKIDEIMIELDGTENKKRLGANAILAVSLAVCRAGAFSKKLPLYLYIKELVNNEEKIKFPFPCFNIINGGAHAENNLDIQEYMIIPMNDSFSKNLEIGVKLYNLLKENLKKKFKKIPIGIGDEGGFSLIFLNNEEPLKILNEVISIFKKEKIKIGIDCAASQFYNSSKNKYLFENSFLSPENLLSFYSKFFKKYPIISIEDPFQESDFSSFKNLKEENKNILIIGDDLTATNKNRLEKAIKENSISGVIVKPNQIGTLTETLNFIKLAKKSGLKIIISHRSGETNDDFISDLSIGISADFIKAGAPVRGERVAKYNRLLKIEKELKTNI